MRSVVEPVVPCPAGPVQPPVSRRARREAEARARVADGLAPAVPLATLRASEARVAAPVVEAPARVAGASADVRPAPAALRPVVEARPAPVSAPTAPAVLAGAPDLPAVVVPTALAATPAITPVADLAVELEDDIELPLSFVRNQAALQPVAAPRRGSKQAFVRIKRRSATSTSRRGAALRGTAGLTALGFAATVAIASTLPAAAAPEEEAAPGDTIIGEAGGPQTFTTGGGAAEVATATSAEDDRAPAYGVATMGSATAYSMSVGVPRPDPAAYTNNLTAAVQWPFPVGVVISDYFGGRVSPCGGCSSDHKGVDFTPGEGTPIGAIAAGRVLTVQPADNGGLGVHVTVEHIINGESVVSVYGHMLTGSISVEVGQVVNVGDELGKVGNTGSSTGAHLHLEIHVAGEQVDPFAYLTEHNIATTVVVRPDTSVST